MTEVHHVEKLPTGIVGLDSISMGGLPKGRTTLLAGSAGSGKTILAAQFLVQGIAERGESGVFVTFEESPEAIRSNLLSMGWDISSWEAEGRFAFVDASAQVGEETTLVVGDYDLGALLARIDLRGAVRWVMGNLDTPLRTILLVGLPLVAVVVVGVLIWRIPRHEVLARYGLALILGGAIGNLIDRLLYGHVVDFIDVYAGWKPLAEFFISWFETNRWPTFNIADVGLVCGACLLVAELFFGRKTGAGDARAEEDTRAPLSD